MKVAIMGKSRLNDLLKEQLASVGFMPVLLEDVKDIQGFGGQKGDFWIDIHGKRIEAGYVVVTQEGECINPLPDVPALSLVNMRVEDVCQDHGGPVVMVLDFPEESPGIMTRIALEKGIALAEKKKRVIFLARFVRTGEEGLEKLYKQARNAGVTFIKYRSLEVDYRRDDDRWDVCIVDDYESLQIGAPVLVLADRIRAGSQIGQAAKLLRLKQDEQGFIGGGSPYLHPAFTSRKGVYVLNNIHGLSLQGDTLSLISHVLSAVRKEENEETNTTYAEVDANKCAFCYTCYRVCPHAAMFPDPDTEKSAMKNFQEACYGCGICASLCPASAIRMMGSRDKEGVPPNTLKVFCCENSAEIAIERIKDALGDQYGRMEITPVSCGGEISTAAIIAALQKYDKVLVAVCMDEACKHFLGNKRAYRQVEKARELLKCAGLKEDRIDYLQVAHAMPLVMADTINELMVK